MQIIFYLLIALTAFYTGSIDKRLKITRSGTITTPLAALTVVGTIIICYVFFKTWLLLLLLLLALLQRMGTTTQNNILVLTGIILATITGAATGPVGWGVLAITGMVLFMLFLPTAENIATGLYTIFLREMMRVLLAARQTGDKLRSLLPHRLRFLVAIVEMPVVCSLAVAGVWQMMNWLYKPEVLSATECLIRLAALTPVTILMYHAYLRDTSNPGVGRQETPQNTQADIAAPVLTV